jgi:hypothetical protein
VRDFATGCCPNCIRRQSDQGERPAVESYKLDLVRGAIAMHMDNSAEVTLAQPLFRKVSRQNDGIKFSDMNSICTETLYARRRLIALAYRRFGFTSAWANMQDAAVDSARHCGGSFAQAS